jgi:hypothetical protein
VGGFGAAFASRRFRKERILEKVWGYYSEMDPANVDLYIHYCFLPQSDTEGLSSTQSETRRYKG